MRRRIHIPFDAWAMQVEVPVSQLVGQDSLAWSCGQCPLDDNGQVYSPGNLIAQAGLVADYIARLVERAGYSRKHIAKLVIYYVDQPNPTPTELVELLRTRLGTRFLIVPVMVPYFYYSGMLIEVDVMIDGSLTADPVVHADQSGNEIWLLLGKRIVWMKCEACSDSPNLESLSRMLSSTIRSITRTGSDRLLMSRWFAPTNSRESVRRLQPLRNNGFIVDPNTVIQTTGPNNQGILGSLIFSREDNVVSKLAGNSGSPAVARIRIAEDLIWISATSRSAETDLLTQTACCMDSIRNVLHIHGATASDIVKLTAHYIGDATAEALHANMRLRHSYYATPGPASSGLPVAAIGTEGRRIAIDVFAMRDPGRRG